MEPLLPPGRRKACVFCRRTMGCSYFEMESIEVLQYVEGGHGGNFILNTPPP